MNLGKGGTGHGGRWRGRGALSFLAGFTLSKEPEGCMGKGNNCDGGGTDDDTIKDGGGLRKAGGGGTEGAGRIWGGGMGMLV